MNIVIIIGVVCLLILAYIKSKNDNDTKPSMGWTQRNGFITKINRKL